MPQDSERINRIGTAIAWTAAVIDAGFGLVVLYIAWRALVRFGIL